MKTPIQSAPSLFRVFRVFSGPNSAWVHLLSVFFLAGWLHADDTIPKPLDSAHYEALWINSPFLRSLNAAESFVITGVTHIDGSPLVTLRNTSTGERFMLSNVKNSQGWRLVFLRSDINPKNVMARVSMNEEEMTVRFDDQQLSDKALLKAAQGVTGQTPNTNPASAKPGAIPAPQANPKAGPASGNTLNPPVRDTSPAKVGNKKLKP